MIAAYVIYIIALWERWDGFYSAMNGSKKLRETPVQQSLAAQEQIV